MMDSPTAEPSLLAAPPPAPRALNRVALRRSWVEPRVRGWWLMAAVVIGAMASIAVDRMQAAHITAYRVAHWVRIDDAKIVQINTTRRDSISIIPGASSPATITYVYPRGTPRETTGTLHAIDNPIKMHEIVPILVDPANPDVWTDRVVAEPLKSQLALTLMLVPLLVILVLGAILMRRKVLRLAQTGRAELAVVVNSRNTATAPMSRAVRCRLTEGRDDRLIQLIVPTRHGVLQAGDELWVIVPARGVHPALAARSYGF